MTPEEFQKLIKSKSHKHKFHAKRTERQGISFSSKMEAKYYDLLVLLQKSGEVLFFLRQVPFQLPGNKKYFLDFLVFYSDGRIEFVECKGFMTPLAKLKLDQIQEIYPVEIKIVKKV